MSQRIESYRSLQAELEAVDLDDASAFSRVFASAHLLLEMTNRDMATALGVSHPSIGRWVNGTAAPHPVMRRAIARWIRAQVSTKLGLLERRAAPLSGSGLLGFPAAAKG